jgi:hypothetical protein
VLLEAAKLIAERRALERQSRNGAKHTSADARGRAGRPKKQASMSTLSEVDEEVEEVQQRLESLLELVPLPQWGESRWEQALRGVTHVIHLSTAEDAVSGRWNKTVQELGLCLNACNLSRRTWFERRERRRQRSKGTGGSAGEAAKESEEEHVPLAEDVPLRRVVLMSCMSTMSCSDEGAAGNALDEADEESDPNGQDGSQAPTTPPIPSRSSAAPPPPPLGTTASAPPEELKDLSVRMINETCWTNPDGTFKQPDTPTSSAGSSRSSIFGAISPVHTNVDGYATNVNPVPPAVKAHTLAERLAWQLLASFGKEARAKGSTFSAAYSGSPQQQQRRRSSVQGGRKMSTRGGALQALGTVPPGARFELTTVCPGIALGPALCRGDAGRGAGLLCPLLGGACNGKGEKWSMGLPQASFGVVDVRDLAQSLVLAALHPHAAGQRYLCVSRSLWLDDIARYGPRSLSTLPCVHEY